MSIWLALLLTAGVSGFMALVCSIVATETANEIAAGVAWMTFVIAIGLAVASVWVGAFS